MRNYLLFKIIIVVTILAFIVFSIMLLWGMPQYDARVSVEYCNGRQDTISIRYTKRLYLDTYKQVVPVLRDFDAGRLGYNICNFSIISQTPVP